MEALGIAKVTLYNTLPDLEASGVFVETRKIEEVILYRLNRDSEVVKGLEGVIRSFSWTLADLKGDDAGSIIDDESKVLKEMAVS